MTKTLPDDTWRLDWRRHESSSPPFTKAEIILQTRLSKVIKDVNFKPHGGERNLVVGELSTIGANVTHGKAEYYIQNRVSGGRNLYAKGIK